MSGESFHSFQERGVPCSWKNKLRLIRSLNIAQAFSLAIQTTKYAATQWNGEVRLREYVLETHIFHVRAFDKSRGSIGTKVDE